MAKKKKHKKFHSKQASSSVAKSVSEQQSAPKPDNQPEKKVSKPVSSQSSGAPESLVPHLPLILRDVRLVVILAVGFVVAELILWYLLGHTSLGDRVYEMIKI